MRLLIIGVIMIMMIPTVQASTIKLLENTDRCEYDERLKLDHCFSKYLLCDNETVKENDVRFIFKERGGIYLNADMMGDKLDTETEIEKKYECLEISITGWKNPFIDVDNVLCYGDICFYEYAWWNTGMTRWPVTYTGYDNPFLLNGTSCMDVGGGIQCVYCDNTTVNAYNDTSTIYCANDTAQVGTFIDEGNGTSYGSPEASLVGWYHMNGTDISDSSIYGRHGSIVGNVVQTAGQIANAIDIDGSSDYATVPDIYDIQTNVGTMSFWMKLNDISQIQTIVSKGLQSSPAKMWYIRWNTGTNVTSFDSYTNHVTDYFVCTSADYAINDKNWHFVTLNWSTTKCYFFIDGILSDDAHGGAGTSGVGGWDVETRVGEEWDGSPEADVIVDELRFYNRSLSHAEIYSMYVNNATVGIMEFPPPPPPPTPIPIHSFIIFKLINPSIPFIGWFLDGLTFKSIILFMDRLTVAGDVIVGGNADISGNANVSGNLTGNLFHGEMWYHNHTATPLNFAVDGRYYNLTFDSSLVNGFTFNDAGDYLESVYAGTYSASYMASGSGQNNHVYYLSLIHI